LDVICKFNVVLYCHGFGCHNYCQKRIYDTCTLAIVDGPSLVLGPPQHYVLLGDSASLVCGAGLDRGNPEATITWTDPDGARVVDDNSFNLENGPDIVRLNLNRTLLSDAGIWRCDIRINSERYIVNNGRLVQINSTMVGAPIQHDIELIIIGEYTNDYSLYHDINQAVTLFLSLQLLLVSHTRSQSKRVKQHHFKSAGKLQSSLIPISHTI
jgi:hypothetical protein